MAGMLRRFRSSVVFAATLVFTLVASGLNAAADELRVMTSGAFTAAYLALKPEFERTTGHTLVAVTTTMGTGDASIPSRLKRGEAADLVVMDDTSLRALIADSLLAADSRIPLVKSSVAMAVKSGTRKPDISTVAGLRQALLDARSIAVSASVSGMYLTKELFPQLGIADRVTPKVQRIEIERVGTVVARGDAEIGFQQMSELLPITGIDIVGPLPAEVQRVTTFSAAIVSRASHAELARAFIRFLTTPAARSVITTTGLEPLVP